MLSGRAPPPIERTIANLSDLIEPDFPYSTRFPLNGRRRCRQPERRLQPILARSRGFGNESKDALFDLALRDLDHRHALKQGRWDRGRHVVRVAPGQVVCWLLIVRRCNDVNLVIYSGGGHRAGNEIFVDAKCAAKWSLVHVIVQVETTDSQAMDVQYLMGFALSFDEKDALLSMIVGSAIMFTHLE